MTMLAPLYEIAGEARAIYEKLMDMDADDQTIADTLEAETDMVPKVQSYGFVIRNMEALETAINAEAERLALRARILANRREALKKRLLDAMVYAGVQKVEHPQFTISVQKNPASVEIFDERQIPADYMTEPKPPEPKPNKTLIKKAIQDGFDVPGAKLVQSVRLAIK
ncbi:siphovirus Gp157 family protein [Bordetella hinzii]|uniref:Bacteriophage resistance factor, PF05565 family n=1 Tax=Bordetella hinzii OH87 BAL007II TaxID=1331262 RepID=A0ABR4R5B8_9BORD|nr:siphovirus Gp157 family protein [Bordetella hinzii]KCB25937.1 bacteriophage resistance factor, PF05565 family [Bordetella hinzii OH87 BAL007II]